MSIRTVPLLVAAIALLPAAWADDAATPAAPEHAVVAVKDPLAEGQALMPVLKTVFRIARPRSTDLIFLKNGDKLTGTVLNKSISMRTGYAAGVKFPALLLTALVFEDKTNMETVVTVNGNKFSGFIDDPAMRIRLAHGQQVRIRREKISRIAFRTRRASELPCIPRSDLITLNNGEFISGVVLNEKFNVQATYAQVSVEVSKVQRVQMLAKGMLTKLTLHGTGDMIQGILLDEDIEINLDCGPTVKIYHDRISTIVFNRGSGKKLELPAGMSATLSSGGEITNSIGMKLVFLGPGTFTMGSPSTEPGRGRNEGPQRWVTLTSGFHMSATEVTQEQYEKVVGTNPSKWKAASRPVEQVLWNNAVAFCKRLTELERKAGRISKRQAYRLPTEAEWEYACRAGSTGRFCFGETDERLDEYAWYTVNSGGQTHPVAQKKPNAWGLYDMHGNVWEWCHDWDSNYPTGAQADPSGPSSGSCRVSRGGSWVNSPVYCRSAHRGSDTPGRRHYGYGFRVVLASGGVD